MDNETEINRLRSRVHKLGSDVSLNKWRLDSMEQTVKKYAEIVDQLKDQSEIDAAVKKAVRENNKVYLTGAQKLGVAIIGGITIADFVLKFI